jgi:hypothetical protein
MSKIGISVDPRFVAQRPQQSLDLDARGLRRVRAISGANKTLRHRAGFPSVSNNVLILLAFIGSCLGLLLLSSFR